MSRWTDGGCGVASEAAYPGVQAGGQSARADACSPGRAQSQVLAGLLVLRQVGSQLVDVPAPRFDLLKDLMVASATPGSSSRVVGVSSMAHRFGPLRLDDINFEGGYDGWAAYASSKTAVVYHMNEIDRRYGAQGVRAYSVHPGAFESPNLQRHSADETRAMMESTVMRR